MSKPINKETIDKLFNHYKKERPDLSDTHVMDMVYDFIHNSLIMRGQ